MVPEFTYLQLPRMGCFSFLLKNFSCRLQILKPGMLEPPGPEVREQLLGCRIEIMELPG